MLHLVKGEIAIHEYMEDTAKRESIIELVEARSEEKAVMAIEQLYEEKSDEFGTSYTVEWCTASKPIIYSK